MATTRGIPNITPDVVRDPAKLYQYLSMSERQFKQIVQDVQSGRTVPGKQEAFIDLKAVRDALQHNGTYPLNVEGLLGVLSDPQLAGLLVVSSEPPASSYPPGTLMVLTGSPDTFKYCKAGTPNTWESISTAPANMMTLDTPQTVDAAAIKTINAVWQFVVDQVFQGRIGVGSTTAPSGQEYIDLRRAENNSVTARVYNEDNGAAAQANVNARSSNAGVGGASVNLVAFGPGRTGNQFGVARAAWASLAAAIGNGLMLGTTHAAPVYFGTNNTLRGSIASSGEWTIPTLLTLSRVGQALLVKPSAAGTPANTRMIEVQDDTGATKFIADIEGDVLLNALIANSTGQFSGLLTALTGLTVSGAALRLDHALNLWQGGGSVSTASTPYAVTASDGYIEHTGTGVGAVSITLPAAPGQGRILFIRDAANSASVNNITITAGAGHTIEGAASKAFADNGFRLGLRFDGADWVIISYYIP